MSLSPPLAAVLALVLAVAGHAIAARALGLATRRWGRPLAGCLAGLAALGLLVHAPGKAVTALALLGLGVDAVAFTFEAFDLSHKRKLKFTTMAPNPPLPRKRGREKVVVAAIAVAVLAPLPIVRAAAIALLVLLVLEKGVKTTLSVASVRILLLAVAAATLVVPAVAKHEGTPREAIDLALVTVGSLAWAWLAASPVTIELAPRKKSALWPEAAALALVLVTSAGPLAAPLAVKGDENVHACRLQLAIDLWNPHDPRGLLAAFAAHGLAAPALALATRSRLAATLGALVLAASAGLLVSASALDASALGCLTRYPLALVWPQALLSLAPATVLSPGLAYAEGWYRLGPLLTTAVLAASVARAAPLPPIGRFLTAAALATIPSVRYYASILYLEVPIVALMLVALAGLARRSWDEVPRSLAWLALLAVPFGKETALPFGAAAAAHALLGVRARAPRETARILASLVVPLILNFLFKNDYRKFVADVSVLRDARLYAYYGAALTEQFGAFLFLVPFGALLAWRRGRGDLVLLALALVLGYSTLYAIDGLWCVFIARFMLFLLPPLLVIAFEVVRAPAFARPVVFAPVLLAIVAANLAQAPVSLDGARRPFWGCYHQAQGDFAYPWSDALSTFAGAPARLAIVGTDNAYPFDTYERKYSTQWELSVTPRPDDDFDAVFASTRAARRTGVPFAPPVDALRADLERALGARPDGAIVQLPPGDLASEWPARAGDYTKTAEPTLGACRIVVYRRDR